MALGDKQILATQVAAGKSDYLIPGAVSLQLKAVSALFTDNGATVNWLPAVVAISDSGHVFWRATDQAVKVTAGSDAEVSWFPGVKHGGTATTVAWGRLTGSSGPQSVAGNPATGNPTLVDFSGGGLSEDGSGVFFFDPLEPNFLQCSVAPSPGVWLVQALTVHDDAAPTGLNPSLVRAYLRFTAPTGSGDSPISSEALLGANSGQPIDPNNLYNFGVSGQQPNNAQTPPVGFGIMLQNFGAAAASFESVSPIISVMLVGVG